MVKPRLRPGVSRRVGMTPLFAETEVAAGKVIPFLKMNDVPKRRRALLAAAIQYASRGVKRTVKPRLRPD